MGEYDINLIIDQAIKGNESLFNTFFEDTYQEIYPKLKSLTNSEDDIKDIYLMSIEKFWQRFVILRETPPNNSIGYIYRMCKNAFLLKKREAWSSIILSDDPDVYNGNQIAEISEKETSSDMDFLKFNALSIALESLSSKCKTLIEIELDGEIRLKDVMEELGYSNYQALVQAKYNCKKRLIKKVIEVLNTLKTEKNNIE